MLYCANTYVSLFGCFGVSGIATAARLSSSATAAATAGAFGPPVFPFTGTKNCSLFKYLLALMHHASTCGALRWQCRSTDSEFNSTQSPSSLLICKDYVYDDEGVDRKTTKNIHEQDALNKMIFNFFFFFSKGLLLIWDRYT